MASDCIGACGADITSERICEGCGESELGPDTKPFDMSKVLVKVDWTNPLAEENLVDTLPAFRLEEYGETLAHEMRIEELIDEDTDTSSPPESEDRYIDFDDVAEAE